MGIKTLSRAQVRKTVIPLGENNASTDMSNWKPECYNKRSHCQWTLRLCLLRDNRFMLLNCSLIFPAWWMATTSACTHPHTLHTNIHHPHSIGDATNMHEVIIVNHSLVSHSRDIMFMLSVPCLCFITIPNDLHAFHSCFFGISFVSTILLFGNQISKSLHWILLIRFIKYIVVDKMQNSQIDAVFNACKIVQKD